MKTLNFLLFSFLFIYSSNSFSMNQTNHNNHEVLKSSLKGFALGAANWVAFKYCNNTTKAISLLLTALNWHQISVKNREKPISEYLKNIIANMGSMFLVFELCSCKW